MGTAGIWQQPSPCRVSSELSPGLRLSPPVPVMFTFLPEEAHQLRFL